LLILDKMQFIDILKLINMCVIVFFYMEYNKTVESLVISLEEEKKNVARLVASLEEEKKNVARLVASLEVASLEVASLEVASLEEEEKKTVTEENPVASEAEVANSSEAEVANLEKDVNTWYAIEDGKVRYKGEWKNGLPNGKGIKHFYKTDSYVEGNFVDSFAHGYGKQTFEQTWEKTVPYYEGEFKRNKWEGKGEYHYGDGDYYKGEWKDSKYCGQGAAYSKRLDRTWVGEYDNDKKVNGGWVKGEI
jgi:hypothetical protein